MKVYIVFQGCYSDRAAVKAFTDKAKAAFKKKWLKADSDRCKRIVDEAIEELRKEMYETFVGGKDYD